MDEQELVEPAEQAPSYDDGYAAGLADGYADGKADGAEAALAGALAEVTSLCRQIRHGGELRYGDMQALCAKLKSLQPE